MEINLFNYCFPYYKITKPIRLIELFGGIGSQAKALENIGVDFEHYKLVEFDRYCIQSYNAIHNTNFLPLDITKLTGKDLEIVDTNKYQYIMAYSFSCQDLSLAGKGRGMKKGDETRSGLLWEVERLLKECKELPQILLMENVSAIHDKKNIDDFNDWIQFLGSLGYSNFYQDLNAKNYGIPQNRKRTFMISILGDYLYEFPKKQRLRLKLKDMLEDEVDEKYFLSQKMINCFMSNGIGKYPRRELFIKNLTRKNQDIANTITTKASRGPIDNFIKEALPIKNKTKNGYLFAEEGDRIDISGRMKYHRGTVQKGISQTIMTKNNVGVAIIKDNSIYSDLEKELFTEDGNIRRYIGSEIIDEFKEGQMATTSFPNGYGHGLRTHNEAITLSTNEKPSVKINLRIRKLTPKECWRLMGFSDEDFDKASKFNSNTQLYKQAGNSIVVNVLEEIFKQFF